MRKHSRNKISKEKCQEILSSAQETVGVPMLEEEIVMLKTLAEEEDDDGFDQGSA